MSVYKKEFANLMAENGGITKKLYCRPPEFTVIQSGKCLAGGLQSGHTVNLIGVQYSLFSD